MSSKSKKKNVIATSSWQNTRQQVGYVNQEGRHATQVEKSPQVCLAAYQDCYTNKCHL